MVKFLSSIHKQLTHNVHGGVAQSQGLCTCYGTLQRPAGRAPPLGPRQWTKSNGAGLAHENQTNWGKIQELHSHKTAPNNLALTTMLEKYKKLFADELGTIQGAMAKLPVDENSYWRALSFCGRMRRSAS